jgi:uncharacterized delta-60 repeat protein
MAYIISESGKTETIFPSILSSYVEEFTFEYKSEYLGSNVFVNPLTGALSYTGESAGINYVIVKGSNSGGEFLSTVALVSPLQITTSPVVPGSTYSFINNDIGYGDTGVFSTEMEVVFENGAVFDEGGYFSFTPTTPEDFFSGTSVTTNRINNTDYLVSSIILTFDIVTESFTPESPVKISFELEDVTAAQYFDSKIFLREGNTISEPTVTKEGYNTLTKSGIISFNKDTFTSESSSVAVGLKVEFYTPFEVYSGKTINESASAFVNDDSSKKITVYLDTDNKGKILTDEDEKLIFWAETVELSTRNNGKRIFYIDDQGNKIIQPEILEITPKGFTYGNFYTYKGWFVQINKDSFLVQGQNQFPARQIIPVSSASTLEDLCYGTTENLFVFNDKFVGVDKGQRIFNFSELQKDTPIVSSLEITPIPYYLSFAKLPGTKRVNQGWYKLIDPIVNPSNRPICCGFEVGDIFEVSTEGLILSENPTICPTPTPTPTQTQTPTQTPTQTQTQTPTQTPSQTSTPTQTSSQTPTKTQTPTQTATKTPTPTQTTTPTKTKTPTPTPTKTQTPTKTATQTPTQTKTPTQTSTPDPISYNCPATFSLVVSQPGTTLFTSIVDLKQVWGNVEVTISSTAFNQTNQIFVGNLDTKYGEIFNFTRGSSTQTKTFGFNPNGATTKLDIGVYSIGDNTNVFTPFTINFTVKCPTVYLCGDRTPTPTPTLTQTPTVTPNLGYCYTYTIKGDAIDTITYVNCNGTTGSIEIGPGQTSNLNGACIRKGQIYAQKSPLSFKVESSGSTPCSTYSNPTESCFTGQTSGRIFDIVKYSESQIYIAGAFSAYNQTVVGKIVRSFTDGRIDTSFNTGTGFDDTVYALAVQSDGKVICGGTFKSFNGISRSCIVRLNSDGSLDTTFSVGSGFAYSGYDIQPVVFKIKIQSDGKIVCVGQFTSYNGSLCNSIVRLNTNGTVDTTFVTGNGFIAIYNVPTAGSVTGLEIQSDGKILALGTFQSYNGITKNGIVRLNTNGSLDTTFVGEFYGNPSSSLTTSTGIKILPDGKIMLLGYFYNYNNVDVPYIIRVNSNGTIDNTFNCSIGINTLSRSTGDLIVQNDGKYVLVGRFDTYNGKTVNSIVGLNTDGSINQAFNAGNGIQLDQGGSSGVVNRIIQFNNGSLIVAGTFLRYNNVSVGNIARLNSNGSIFLCPKPVPPIPPPVTSTPTTTPTKTVTPSQTKTPARTPSPTPSANSCYCFNYKILARGIDTVTYVNCNGTTGSISIVTGQYYDFTCLRENQIYGTSSSSFQVVSKSSRDCPVYRCVSPTPTPTQTKTPTRPTVTRTPTPTKTKTPTPTVTPTKPTLTRTPTPTKTQTPTKPTVSKTPTQTPTKTKTPTPTQTKTPTPTPTRSKAIVTALNGTRVLCGLFKNPHIGANIILDKNVTVNTTFVVKAYLGNPSNDPKFPCVPNNKTGQYTVTIPANSNQSNIRTCDKLNVDQNEIACCQEIISCDNPNVNFNNFSNICRR